MRSFLKLCFLLLLCVGFIGAWFWYDYRSALREPLTLGDEQILYTVARGMNFRGVANDLDDRGWWAHPQYLLLRVHEREIAGGLKSGEYSLAPGMSLDQLIDMLVSGKTVQHPITIIEGWTFAQVRLALEGSPVLEHTLTGMDDEAVMQELGYAGVHPEGRFFPDTYYVTRGTTDAELMSRAYARMQSVTETLWKERDGDLPYQSIDEALIMASIVEKETAVGPERPLVASVFVQRLKRGMRLQTDPTVIYGLGLEFDGNLRRKDIEADNAYNTYTRTGLPPTPIAMPGKDSIIATLHPADEDALYFVARGDGSHEFSATVEDHNRAVQKYQIDARRTRERAP